MEEDGTSWEGAFDEDTLKFKIQLAFDSYIMNLVDTQLRVKMLNSLVSFAIDTSMEEGKDGGNEGVLYGNTISFQNYFDLILITLKYIDEDVVATD